MSEYKPITQGLREAMNLDGWATNGTYCVKLSADMDEFNGLCDDIDALHKSLEQECEKLREKVDNQRKQLTEIQDAMHRRNNGELKRRWQKQLDELKADNAELLGFANRVKDAVNKREDVTLWGIDYIAGPVDKYGTPISMSSCFDGEHGFPTSVWYHAETGCWYVNFSKDGQIKAEECVVREPSVMDLLDELLMKWPDCEGPVEELALKKRIASCLQIAEVEGE